MKTLLSLVLFAQLAVAQPSAAPQAQSQQPQPQQQQPQRQSQQAQAPQPQGRQRNPDAARPQQSGEGAVAEAVDETPSVTHHEIRLGGKTLAYTATVAQMPLKNPSGETEAHIFYMAYTVDGADSATRPLTFCFNGGPGSASIWVHMGAMGPRKAKLLDNGDMPPPPYKIVDNEHTWLDQTDLVFIDPVGTGYSRAKTPEVARRMNGVQGDLQSVGEFMRMYVTRNDRWMSPLFIAGESYGTFRAAGLAGYLIDQGMAFNGVILVSVALDLEAIFNSPGNDRPYPLFLPTYAAVAWFHKTIPNRSEKLEPFLDEVRAWATGPYASALMKGDAIGDAERDAVARKLHEYTGLSEEYVRRSNLRIDEAAFTQELLRDRGETVGRLDARYTGPTLDAIGRDAEYDPQSAAITAAYTSAFLDYYQRDLGFGKGKTYIITNYGLFPQWDFKHKAPGARFPSPFTNTGLDLAHALTVNPNLRVLVLNGYFDLATPFLATEEMMSHLLLAKDLRPHVEMKYYAAGHMMYVNEDALKAMKADVAAFMDRTMRANR